ncbi:MAG: hypothetical protein WA058_00850 [Minisyncoccia bacterium]
MTGKTLILISELWQVDELGANPDGTVVALDAEIEEALGVRGIPFVSAREYRTPDLASRDAANAWAVQVLEDPKRPFAEYRGVSLGRVYFYPLYLYFIRLAYWLDIVASLLERHPGVERLVVYPTSSRATETTGDLAQEGMDALVDSAKLLGVQKGITVAIPPAPPTAKSLVIPFTLKRRLFGYLLGVWNVFMSLRPTRPIRILVSDYWRNVGPLMTNLPNAELIFIDRLQALQAGIGNMWRWRMRFYHLDTFSYNSKEWPHIKADASFSAQFRGYDVGPLLSAAQSALLQHYLPDAFRDIDGAYAMLEKLRPSVIVLRVSTAPQRHYAILAQVGHMLGIPSVEFQHGLEYNGTDSFTRRKNAQYLGVYGPLIEKELISAGIEQERIEVVGSPRFDVYEQEHAQCGAHSGLSVLCIYPDLSYGDDHDSYDIDTFMRGVADAVRIIPGAHLTIKLRGPRREAFSRRRIKELCKDMSYTIVRDAPLSTLFEHSDVVVSCYSSAMLEAMQSGVPLIFFAAIPFQVRMTAHFAPYCAAGALDVARDKDELASTLRSLESEDACRVLVERADRFLSENYSFDGHSAERAASLIRRLAKGT